MFKLVSLRIPTTTRGLRRPREYSGEEDEADQQSDHIVDSHRTVHWLSAVSNRKSERKRAEGQGPIRRGGLDLYDGRLHNNQQSRNETIPVHHAGYHQ